MKIAAVQWEIQLGQVAKNYAAADRWVAKAAQDGADIVVLPELWNTAFFPADVAALADKEGIQTRKFLQQAARQYGVYIVGGSVATVREGRLYNTLYVVDRQGQWITQYDKVHLFTRGREDRIFSAGRRPCVWDLDGFRAGAVICYDLRFDEWLRTLTLSGCEILFVPAAWPAARGVHWDLLTRACAVMQQCVVVAVNGCGQSGDISLYGHSAIIDPWGKVLAQGGDEAAVVMAETDIAQVAAVRKKMPVLADRRPEVYVRG